MTLGMVGVQCDGAQRNGGCGTASGGNTGGFSGGGGVSGGGNEVKKRLTADQETRIREFYFRGINYYSNNRYQDAIAEWRKVLAIDPNHAKAKNNIRQTLILLRQK